MYCQSKYGKGACFFPLCVAFFFLDFAPLWREEADGRGQMGEGRIERERQRQRGQCEGGRVKGLRNHLLSSQLPAQVLMLPPPPLLFILHFSRTTPCVWEKKGGGGKSRLIDHFSGLEKKNFCFSPSLSLLRAICILPLSLLSYPGPL